MIDSAYYNEIRKLGLEANDKTPLSVCNVGKGFCCDNEVPITPEDENVISQAIESGEIDPSVIEQAVKNLSNKYRKGKCPFLSPQNRCMIYQQRPLVCVGWGIGGQIRSPFRPEELFQGVYAQRFGPNVDKRKIICYACEKCQGHININEISYPYEVIRGSFLAVTYGSILAKGRLIVDFIRDNLAVKDQSH